MERARKNGGCGTVQQNGRCRRCMDVMRGGNAWKSSDGPCDSLRTCLSRSMRASEGNRRKTRSPRPPLGEVFTPVALSPPSPSPGPQPKERNEPASSLATRVQEFPPHYFSFLCWTCCSLSARSYVTQDQSTHPSPALNGMTLQPTVRRPITEPLSY